MILSRHNRWLLGSFLIFADNHFIARRAREILLKDGNITERTGVLKLSTGEVVQWANLDLPRRPSPSRYGIKEA